MQEPLENSEEHSEEYLENLRMENEIKKIKLSLEHGTDLSSQLSNAELPPEVEGKFLDYISQFEAEYAKRKTILIYDLINRPDWRPESEISDDEISDELARITKILHDNSISLDTICKVDDRVLYKFITEELFNHETNDIRIPGMTHGFIYEEFHPNHEHDIKKRCSEFLQLMLNKDREWKPQFFSFANFLEGTNGLVSEEDAIVKLSHFRDSFSAFDIQEFEFVSLSINDAVDKAEAIYNLKYTGTIDGSLEQLAFDGPCQFWLKKDYEWWDMYKLGVPGISL